MTLVDPVVFERGDSIFMIAPVAPITPASNEVEEYAFSKAVKDNAPNEHLLWLRGQYVEADRANANGQMWAAGELAIKSLTPMLMPVTVMHDPRTAVGLIADTQLLLPGKDDVPRSRIDTTLAIWAHRFPEIAEEISVNYERGELMQSMECKSPFYSCAECGKTFAKLPDGAERAQWCEHLSRQEVATSVAGRILGNVTFTGTGLIFGTRGARGANDKAFLEVAYQDEIAEYHERSHRDKPKTSSSRRQRTMEITDKEYQDLLAKAQQADLVPDLQAKADALETEKKRADDAEAKVATLETEKQAEVEAREAAETKVTEHEEQARKTTLSGERLGKLGKDFKAKLGEKTKERLNEQAGSLSDEEWTARLDELAELLDVKPDAGGTEPDKTEEEEFSTEEIASSAAGGSAPVTPSVAGGSGSTSKSRSVVGGLFAQTGPKKDS